MILSDMGSWLIQFLLQWYVWLPIVAMLIFLTWRNYKKASVLENYEYVILVLDLPSENDKTEIAAEQMFTALHGILRDREELKLSGGFQEHLSFEMASSGGQLRFYVRTPRHLQNFVESQILAQYPTIGIREVQDYANLNNFPVAMTADVAMIDNESLPIKTYRDSYIDTLTATAAALTRDANSETWLQILIKPIDDRWHNSTERFIQRSKAGVGKKDFDFLWFIEALAAMWKPPKATDMSAKELSERDQLCIESAEKKAQKIGYKVQIRAVSLSANQGNARTQLTAVFNALKQFQTTDINGLKMLNKPNIKRENLQKYTSRYFSGGFILNPEEIATIWHLPHNNIEQEDIENIDPETVADESANNLPIITGDRENDEKISAFGLVKVNDLERQFGIYRDDRSRHVYVIGQTGTGKTALLELLALSDIYHGVGYAIIDPHGDFASDNLKFIPAHRVKDVIYFNPADTDFPIGFNPMEVYDPSQRNNISSEIIGVLKRMFDNSWGPRLEYILRYTILALLESPNATMLDITRMLTDKKFREKVLSHVTDIVVLQFWKIEFGSWGERETSLAVAPILNKVGAFVANPIIRNIIGQPKSTFNMREIMDNGKILVINLSKGLIGEDNSAILGALLVTKIQLAAMSRSDIPNIEDRRPFYLYVDEFQNFATDSFAVILSEARKYGLNLTVANQYISQMSETVRKAVFGNVGTVIAMRSNPEDAPTLAPQFAPYFEVADLLQMNNRRFLASMVVRDKKNPAVSGDTLKLPPAQTDFLAQIIENTRANFAKPRQEVEQKIARNLELTANPPVQKPKTLVSAPLKNIIKVEPPRILFNAKDETELIIRPATKKSSSPNSQKSTRSRSRGQRKASK
ncbi:MAG: type IV secretion system DNA-binding domain-containing protein [Candidatus Nomurabacteria bacterium]|jgi:hypothetical protein|nr:type IV secretion system DNA-binding domain-containing protein [Candidatus Nomurabacteria bacterium]